MCNQPYFKHRGSGVTCLLDRCVLWKLWLVGQPEGASSLDPDGLYFLNALWPQEERRRSQAHKSSIRRDHVSGNAIVSAPATSDTMNGHYAMV